eukprot:3006531-Amphidinium_carterae.1
MVKIVSTTGQASQTESIAHEACISGFDISWDTDIWVRVEACHREWLDSAHSDNSRLDLPKFVAALETTQCALVARDYRYKPQPEETRKACRLDVSNALSVAAGVREAQHPTDGL